LPLGGVGVGAGVGVGVGVAAGTGVGDCTGVAGGSGVFIGCCAPAPDGGPLHHQGRDAGPVDAELSTSRSRSFSPKAI